MATCHGVQKDGMVLILSLEVLLLGECVNLHLKGEVFVFSQPLHVRLLILEIHSRGSSCRLRVGLNSSKAEAVVYNFYIQGFQSCHYGLWSKVNFLKSLSAVQSRNLAALSIFRGHNS
jgi:hypothetical protein